MEKNTIIVDLIHKDTQTIENQLNNHIQSVSDIEIEKLAHENVGLQTLSEEYQDYLQNSAKDHFLFLEAFHTTLADYEKSVDAYKERINDLEYEIAKKIISIEEKQTKILNIKNKNQKIEKLALKNKNFNKQKKNSS